MEPFHVKKIRVLTMILFNSLRNEMSEFIARLRRSKSAYDEQGISMENVKSSNNTTYEDDYDDVASPIHRPPGMYWIITVSKEGGHHFIKSPSQ